MCETSAPLRTSEKKTNRASDSSLRRSRRAGKTSSRLISEGSPSTGQRDTRQSYSNMDKIVRRIRTDTSRRPKVCTPQIASMFPPLQDFECVSVFSSSISTGQRSNYDTCRFADRVRRRIEKCEELPGTWLRSLCLCVCVCVSSIRFLFVRKSEMFVVTPTFKTAALAGLVAVASQLAGCFGWIVEFLVGFSGVGIS